MSYRIIDDRLTIDHAPCSYVPTPYVGSRIEPSLIIMHDTAGSAAGAIAWFQKNPSQVSAHFVIDRQGVVTQMAPCDRRTNHAGVSEWKGRKYCNGFAIGIELESPGRLEPLGDEGVSWAGKRYPRAQCVLHDGPRHGGQALWLPYTAAQLAAAEALVRALLIAYPTIVWP